MYHVNLKNTWIYMRPKFLIHDESKVWPKFLIHDESKVGPTTSCDQTGALISFSFLLTWKLSTQKSFDILRASTKINFCFKIFRAIWAGSFGKPETVNFFRPNGNMAIRSPDYVFFTCSGISHSKYKFWNFESVWKNKFLF